ncbi:MAG: glycogen synthase GlgA [Acidobacteria bacterium]|nr:glycogen synthase GlgA [Acidobacteriota bacterium]
MKRILLAASECHPLAKTGGLADVVGALPPELAALGHAVAIVMPRYRRISLEGATHVWGNLPVWMHDRHYRTDIFRVHHRGVPVFLVDAPQFFDRQGLYEEHGQPFADNHLRFAVFSEAVLGVARHLFPADVLHCHDWHTGLAPLYLRLRYPHDPALTGMKTLFSVHNMEHQGRFPQQSLWDMGLDERFFNSGALEFWGQVNLMKAGLIWSDAISTVSRRHAYEMMDPDPELSYGLDGVVRERSHLLTGIVNGVDYGEWNPATDPHIAANYTAGDLVGKQACKRELLDIFGLPRERMNRPLIGIVSRMAHQKGFDLMAQVIQEIVNLDPTLVVLGSGESRYEQMFTYFAGARPQQIGARIGFDNALAHKIEAGADMFLMPSLYEPCGLNQMYSLKYGTPPLVRATGGLDDTIRKETGFKFWEKTGHALLLCVQHALEQFQDRDGWTAMMQEGMLEDFSWSRAAPHYSALYERL